MAASLPFATLASYFERLEGTTKRLEMTAILVELLDDAPASDLPAISHLLQGQIAPDWEGIELGLAEKMILRTLEKATGANDVTKRYHDVGDLGLAAQELLATKKTAQVGLAAFGSDASGDLTVADAFAALHEIAATTGAGSQDLKHRLLQKLLQDATAADPSGLAARYIIRAVAGRLRLGVQAMTFLDALTAWRLGRGVRSVQEMEGDERAEAEALRVRLERGFDFCSDLATVATALASGGPEAVDALAITHGTPLRPMAAERLKTVAEILEKHGGRSAVEYKYDGLRIQAHIDPGSDRPVRLFSRRLEELTDQFPDVQQHLLEAFDGKQAIVEGEVVAVDLETGRLRPFQDVSRRRGRKTGLPTAQVTGLGGDQTSVGEDVTKDVPVVTFLFDCMALDGASIMQEGYEARRQRMMDAMAEGDRVKISTMQVCQDEVAVESFFTQAVADGAEGIMCKALDAAYKAGNRGFDWIKYKTDYTEDLVDTMDLVVVGAFYGRGRRAGWYGALLMACYDPDADLFRSVCKLGTGFDDATLMGLKQRFEETATQEKPAEVDATMEPDVWIRPDTVMEVQAAELTLSPAHRTAWGQLRDGAGLAARFPRFSGRWRDDKSPDQATTVGELVQMYEVQGKRAA